MTKLKNRVKKEANGLVQVTFDLHNDSVNGRKLGCWGYVLNEDNGRCVYVNTDEVAGGGYAPLAGKALVRYEDDPKWWSRERAEERARGGFYGRLARQNQWVDADRLAWAIVRMLMAPEPVNVEFEGRESALEAVA